jgi:DNA-directed RNA polymerase specialized sigma24 family protein
MSTQPNLAHASPSERVEPGENVAMLLSRLPPRLRLPVVLCDMRSLTHREAAGALKLSLGTLKTRLRKAHALLRARSNVAARRARWR